MSTTRISTSPTMIDSSFIRLKTSISDLLLSKRKFHLPQKLGLGPKVYSVLPSALTTDQLGNLIVGWINDDVWKHSSTGDTKFCLVNIIRTNPETILYTLSPLLHS